jgi:hypothetical protein
MASHPWAGQWKAGSGRRRVITIAAIELGVVLVAIALAGALRPDVTSHPERVSSRVAICDASSAGAAQVTYILTNGDRTEHAYKVELTVEPAVAGAAAPLGSGVSLVGGVKPGGTATARVLVPLTGHEAKVTCKVSVNVHDGHGHHGS